MVLIVKIMMNETLLKQGWAKRMRPKTAKPHRDTMCEYLTHSNKVIHHRYGDGAVALAKKILEEME